MHIERKLVVACRLKSAEDYLLAVGAVFFLTALVMFLFGCAWLLYFYLPGNDYTFFWGFFAMAVILVVLGGVAVLIALRAVKRGAPPTPTTVTRFAAMSSAW